MFLGIPEDTSDEEDPNTYGETTTEPGGRHAHVQNSSNVVEESASRECELIVSAVLENCNPAASLEKDLPDALHSVVVKAEPQEDELLNERVSFSLPRKRRRLVPEVVVPTWASLQQRNKKNLDKINKMNNPKFKKTKDMELSLSSIYNRLKDVGLDPYEVALESEIRDVSVSRQFMSSVYGGGAQDVFPIIGAEKLAQHGIKYFMYVNVESHSHAPQFVGNPGLFFVSQPGKFDDLYYVFVRLNAAEWLYVGIYCLILSPSLSKEEWKSMTEHVRRKWVNMIFKKGWAGGFRQKIAARRNKIIEKITLEDIRSVLDSGEETLGVYTMKCVGYDENFQRELAVRYPNWVPPPPRPRDEGGKGEGTGSETKTETRAKARGSRISEKKGKRKLGETPGSETPNSGSKGGVVDQFHEVSIDSDQQNMASSSKVKPKRRSQRLRGPLSKHSANVLELSDSESESDVHFADNWERSNGTRDDPIVL